MAVDPEEPTWWLGDLDATYEQLRRESPVHEYAPNRYLVTRHADIRAISSDPTRFSSERGVLIDDPLRENPGRVPSLLHMDPPRHGPFRALVARQFTPRAVTGMEPRIQAMTEAIIAACPRDECDLVHHLAVPLPLRMIADMLGMDDVDPDQFRYWSDETIKAADTAQADMVAVGEFLTAQQRAIDDHRARPRDDVLQLLVDGDVDGRQLNSGELVVYCMALLVAGNETTRNLISGGLIALAEHPEQRAWLAQHPEAMPAAVEELLRFVTPIKAMCRTVTERVELHDIELAPGAIVVLDYAAANRDRTVWGPTADSFDVQRAGAAPQVAFGFGEHLCLGASLARMEARIMFRVLLDTFPDYRITGAPRRLASTLINGWASIPGRLT